MLQSEKSSSSIGIQDLTIYDWLPDILEVADGVVVELGEGQHLAGAVPGVAGEVEFDAWATAGQADLADAGQVVPCQAQLSQTH